MKDQRARSQATMTWIAVGIGIAVFVGVVFYVIQPLLVEPELPESATDVAAVMTADAMQALTQENYAAARAMAEKALETAPTSTDALLIAGESAARMGDTSAALTRYLAVPNDGNPGYVTSRWAAGNIYLFEGKLSQAEALFRAALEIDPHNIIAHERLAFILGVEGRNWEAVPHLFDPIRQGQIAMEPLVLLGVVGGRNVMNPEIIQRTIEVEPDDPRPLIGLARAALLSDDVAKARQYLQDVLQREPGQVKAHALLGRIVVGSDDAAQVQSWLDQLPAEASGHPEIWYWQAVWADKNQQPEAAARCFWETVKLNPNHMLANRRLAELLVDLGRERDAEPFRDKAEKLAEWSQLLDELYELREEQQPDEEMVKKLIQAAETTEALGRFWEAWAWYQLVLSVEPKNTRAGKQIQRLNAEVAEDSPQVIPDAQPARQVDLGSSLPLPDSRGPTPVGR